MASDYPLDDPLLVALRAARPTLDAELVSPESPAARRMLAHILDQPTVADESAASSRIGALQAVGFERGARRSRRRLSIIAALVAAVVFVAVALADQFGGFSAWLTGTPGAPASTAAQRAFDRATRSWEGFPRATQLRLLAQTSVGGATYTLYGFRGEGALCLRLVVTGAQTAHQLACPPLSLLRSTAAPALVAVADAEVGIVQSHNGVGEMMLAPEALVTFG